MTPFCASCGTKTESDWNSCPECGSNLSEQKLDGGSQPAVPKQPQSYQPSPSQYRPAYNPYQKPTTYPRGQTTYPRSKNIQSASSGFGIASLIVAIIGLCVSGVMGIGFFLGIIAIILGAIGKARDYSSGFASAGIAIGVIDLCCSIYPMIYLFSFLFNPYYY